MSAQKSDNSQGDTGTRDITYDLVSVIYHALQGAETTAMYIADAEQEGNQELVRRGDRAKQLLTTHLGSGQGRSAAGGGKS
jgi:hypothetical protein